MELTKARRKSPLRAVPRSPDSPCGPHSAYPDERRTTTETTERHDLRKDHQLKNSKAPSIDPAQERLQKAEEAREIKERQMRNTRPRKLQIMDDNGDDIALPSIIKATKEASDTETYMMDSPIKKITANAHPRRLESSHNTPVRATTRQKRKKAKRDDENDAENDLLQHMPRAMVTSNSVMNDPKIKLNVQMSPVKQSLDMTQTPARKRHKVEHHPFVESRKDTDLPVRHGEGFDNTALRREPSTFTKTYITARQKPYQGYKTPGEGFTVTDMNNWAHQKSILPVGNFAITGAQFPTPQTVGSMTPVAPRGSAVVQGIQTFFSNLSSRVSRHIIEADRHVQELASRHRSMLALTLNKNARKVEEEYVT